MCLLVPALYMHVQSTYRLDAEAKGSTGFRIPEDVYKSQGRQPEGFMTSEGILNTVDPIG